MRWSPPGISSTAGRRTSRHRHRVRRAAGHESGGSLGQDPAHRPVRKFAGYLCVGISGLLVLSGLYLITPGAAERADDARGLEKTVLPVLVEKQIAQEPADEGTDDSQHDGRRLDESTCSGVA